jgi:hypothetical protein
MAKIEARINAMGEVVFDVTGAVGGQCTELTKALEKAVSGDGTGVNRTYKPEYSQAGGVQQGVQQRW